MSRGLFSALSAFTIVTGTAVFYLWRKSGQEEENIADRLLIKKVLIQLRKRVYSTLREISFIVNHIRTLEGDLEVKKISQIFVRDGGSGQKKLQAIETLVLEEAHLTRTSISIIEKEFQASCNHYCQTDIEIKLLLELFRKDLNMALEGVIESYHGPLPSFSSEKVLKILEQIIKRRMGIICKKYIEKVTNEECLRLQAQMQQEGYKASQEYLFEEGISHEKEPNQKVFMSMLEHFYRHDYQFKDKFEKLELDLELCTHLGILVMIQIENKYANKEAEKEEEVPEVEKKSRSSEGGSFFRRRKESSRSSRQEGMREEEREY